MTLLIHFLFILFSAFAADANSPLKDRLTSRYLTTIRPLLERRCFVCHGTGVKLPWYHAIPIVKQLIDHDIHEAKENVDMSQGFPFRGKGSVAEITASLKDEIEDNLMPPFRYRIMHSESKWNEKDLKILFDWIKDVEKEYQQ